MVKREFMDLSKIGQIIELSICGVELTRELCAILRKLVFVAPDKVIALTEQVPMVTNWFEFEKEVRQTQFGRLVNAIYATLLKVGSITDYQKRLIEKARKWGRAMRGSDDYGIYIMLVNNGSNFLESWDCPVSFVRGIHANFSELLASKFIDDPLMNNAFDERAKDIMGLCRWDDTVFDGIGRRATDRDWETIR